MAMTWLPTREQPPTTDETTGNQYICTIGPWIDG
jgi:hypothetical protein